MKTKEWKEQQFMLWMMVQDAINSIRSEATILINNTVEDMLQETYPLAEFEKRKETK